MTRNRVCILASFSSQKWAANHPFPMSLFGQRKTLFHVARELKVQKSVQNLLKLCQLDRLAAFIGSLKADSGPQIQHMHPRHTESFSMRLTREKMLTCSILSTGRCNTIQKSTAIPKNSSSSSSPWLSAPKVFAKERGRRSTDTYLWSSESMYQTTARPTDRRAATPPPGRCGASFFLPHDLYE